MQSKKTLDSVITRNKNTEMFVVVVIKFNLNLLPLYSNNCNLQSHIVSMGFYLSLVHASGVSLLFI